MKFYPPHGKKLDIIIVIILNILGFLYAYIMRTSFFGSVLFSICLVGIPPIIYLSIRKKKEWKKIVAFTIVFGLLYDALLLEFFAEATHSWNVINATIPFKLFGVIPLDSILGQGILSTTYIAVFYEHFFHNERSKHISSNLLYAILLGLYALLGIYVTYFTNPQRLLFIQYPYLTVGLIAILPTILIAFHKPVIFKRMAMMGVYFFFLFLAFEIIGVSYSWWVFRGESYIGWIELLNIRFPFEEVFFWMFFYPATLIFFYEYFIDGEKCLPQNT